MAFTYGMKKSYFNNSYMIEHVVLTGVTQWFLQTFWGKMAPRTISLEFKMYYCSAEPVEGSSLILPPVSSISCESYICLMGLCWDHCRHKHFTVVEGVILVTKKGEKCTPQPTSNQSLC